MHPSQSEALRGFSLGKEFVPFFFFGFTVPEDYICHFEPSESVSGHTEAPVVNSADQADKLGFFRDLTQDSSERDSSPPRRGL